MKPQAQVEYRAIADLKELPGNPRTIKKDQFEKLKQSIKDNADYFEARPIILSDRTGELVILAGNQRYKAAKAIGLLEVPTILLEGLTEAREKEIIIRDNVENGDWDWDELANTWDAARLTEWGVQMPDWASEAESEIIEDEAPEPETDKPAKSKLGEIYQLGDHRLMVGDATSQRDVQLLMNGVVADIAFSSPPYNAGQTATETAMGKKSKYENDDDNKSQEEYRQFLDAYLRICFEHARYTFINVQSLANNKKALIGVMYDNMDFFADTIIWDKQNAQPAMANNVLNSRFEYVHCFSKNATRSIGCLDFRGTLDNVLSMPSQRKNEFSDIHNATFSTDFAAWFVKNFAKDSVLDSFGGTGTTLIACEKLNRKCYMMELDPHYADVIIERWEKFTGEKAIKIKEAA